jgi:outer membrane porin, OprD family
MCNRNISSKTICMKLAGPQCRLLYFLFILAFGSIIPFLSTAQITPYDNSIWKGKEMETTDKKSLLYSFKNGQLEGHFRYFFMATDNKKGLTDYHAHAVGGGIRYITAPFYGFQIGVGGFFGFNIGSSDLGKPDSSTGVRNRYEIGLFDVEDPYNKNDLDRLEELFIKYNFKKSTITLGKQLPMTPFINLQDGRMRPTDVNGVMADIRGIHKVRIEAGYLWSFSPRSTIRWFSTGESIGVYPQGINEEGTPSNYAGNLESKGVGLLGITFMPDSSWKFQLWNQYVENVMNHIYAQVNYEHPLARGKILLAGQYIRQDAIADGGNTDPAKTYIQPGSKANIFGLQGGWKNKKNEWTLNYTRITNDGRFLMPREWGREPLFTFLPRERNEGAGDVNALVAKYTRRFPKWNLRTELAYGHHYMPDVKDYEMNKYGMPSYSHLHVNARYLFQGLFKGMEVQLLYLYKGKLGNTYGNDKYVIHKVDMSLWNFILNYHF